MNHWLVAFNTIKPCENLTERNPYNEDLAEYAADAGMGRAQANDWKKTCINKTLQIMSKQMWALMQLNNR